MVRSLVLCKEDAEEKIRTVEPVAETESSRVAAVLKMKNA